MNNFFIYLIFCLVVTAPLAYWAYRRDQSPVEFIFLSFIASPLVPFVILLLAQIDGKAVNESREKAAS